MSAQANQRLVEEYFRGPSADYFAEDAQLHDTSQPQPLRGRDSIRDFMKIYLGEAFPGGRYTVLNVVADERQAVAEWRFEGVNSGPIMGVDATGRAVEFCGVSVYRIEDGRFAHVRVYYDTGTLADQLGLTGGRIPSTERARWSDWWEERTED